MSSSPYRSLPAVNEVLADPAAAELVRVHGRNRTTEAIRTALGGLRARIRSGESPGAAIQPAAIAADAASRLASADRPRLRPVINATGIVLHTNLGRAPLAAAAVQALSDAAGGYVNLELDLETGQRSHRTLAIRNALCQAIGAESATAVNNCAAATVLVLRALAAGREAIVSRGQLVEIGGSFRIPEIMAASGAILREVGTTNITRTADYENAIGPATALLVRIHQSNFRVHGFTEMPAISELVELGRRAGIPVVDDIGSGALLDFQRFALGGEPLASESLSAGADLVLFSGDKLMGGPQAGIIAGRAELIDRIERDPLMRAFRLDKMTLAALEATLTLYGDADRAIESVPVLQMLNQSVELLRARADAIVDRIRLIAGLTCEVRDDVGYVGGGSLPDQSLPTSIVALRSACWNEDEFARRLRCGEPAVVGRVQGGELLLDIRTVLPDQEDDLVGAIAAAATP